MTEGFTPEFNNEPTLTEVRAQAVQEERELAEDAMWAVFRDAQDDVPIISMMALMHDVVENRVTPAQKEKLSQVKAIKQSLDSRKAEIKKANHTRIKKMQEERNG